MRLNTFFTIVVTVYAGLTLTAVGMARAESVAVAVASNFSIPLKAVVKAFQVETGYEVVVSQGSTGKLYAQIRAGAPFDVFLAADAERPKLLEDEGFAITGSRFTFAQGRLVLWSSNKDLLDGTGAVLGTDRFKHLAIANPKLAPYGLAAQNILKKLGHWEKVESRLIRGENISQTLHFVATGNAELGFVAMSQVIPDGRMEEGSSWIVPQEMYEPIDQQAVLLKETEAAKTFLDFLKGDKARKIIKDFGYNLPEEKPKPAEAVEE